MNRWILIRRLRGPAFLLLFGLTALLNQWGALSFVKSWPLYLILAGVLTLAERAAFRDSALSGAPLGTPIHDSSTGYTQPGQYPPGTAMVASAPAADTGTDSRDADTPKGGE